MELHLLNNKVCNFTLRSYTSTTSNGPSNWKIHDHIPPPPGNTLLNAAQDIISLLCHKGILLDHVQQWSPGHTLLFLQSCFPAGWLPACMSG